jgi:hypothetical protein
MADPLYADFVIDVKFESLTKKVGVRKRCTAEQLFRVQFAKVEELMLRSLSEEAEMIPVFKVDAVA